MPVVLEEFGCKLDARPDQYRLAYDSCLTSAKRGGSCAGVMFWDLAHKVTCQPEPASHSISCLASTKIIRSSTGTCSAVTATACCACHSEWW